MKDWERKNQNEYNRPQSINDERRRAQQLAEERRKWITGEKYVYDAPRKQGNFTSADRERPIAPDGGRQPSAQNKPAPKKDKNKKKNKRKADYRSNDERRRDYAKGARKRRKKNVVKAMIFAVIIAVGVLITLSLTVLFKIETITVSGDTRYAAEQVIEAAEVHAGDNLWRTTSQSVTEKLSAALPYVGSAKVVRKIPSGVEIVITETLPVYSISANKSYILIDGDDKVLEEHAAKRGNTVLIKGVQTLNTKAGTTLTVKSPESYEAAKEIVAEAEASGVKLTEADVTDINMLTAVYGGRIKLEFGSRSDMNSKLRMAKEIIAKLDKENKKTEGVINLKSVTKAFFTEKEINTTVAAKNDDNKGGNKSDNKTDNKAAKKNADGKKG